MMKAAVFLDRDGTLIEDKNYICNLSESFIFPFAFEAVRIMNDLGYKVIIVTNQSAVARGICTYEQVVQLHRELTEAFARENAVIDDIFFCPHHPEGIVKQFRKLTLLRKPDHGMLLEAQRLHNIDFSQSFMVGDQYTDILAGDTVGCKTTLVLTGKGKEQQTLLAGKEIQPTTIAKNVHHFATLQLPPVARRRTTGA